METIKIKKIDKKLPLPRYYQIYQSIKEGIILGKHKKGDKLPSERELSLYFGVSRLTLRKAIEELSREGILIKEWGKGIFINKMPEDKVTKKYKIGITLWNGEEISFHPATLEFLRGAWSLLSGSLYDIELIFITPEVIEKKKYEFLVEKNIVGLILLVGQIPDKDIEKIKKLINHIVFINRQCEEISVNFDSEKQTYKVTEYLIKKGHKKIGFINGPDEREHLLMGKTGYIKCLEKYGISFNPEIYKSGEYLHKTGYIFGKEIIRHSPTAVILGDHLITFGFLDFLKEKGLKCPSDISIISFNDFPFAEYTDPPLTTVKIPFYEMAQKAVEKLMNVIEGKKEKKEFFEGEMIERESVKEI